MINMMKHPLRNQMEKSKKRHHEPFSSEDDEVDVQKVHDKPDWNPASKVKRKCKQKMQDECLQVQAGSFYAVLFRCRSGKTLYISKPGPTSTGSENLISMKFLEKKDFSFDWTKTPGIDLVELSKVICQVEFQGPPPFKLGEKRFQEIINLAKKMV